MEKAQLMEYLKAVCEAEEAAYACEETIGALKQELYQNNRPILPPRKPERRKPEYATANHSKTLGCALAAVFGFVGFLMGCFISTLDSVSAIAVALLWPILIMVGVCTGLYLSSISGNRRQEKENTMRREQAERDYQNALRDFNNNEMKVFEKQVEAQRKIAKAISDAVEENETMQARIQTVLKELYAQGIIYSAFQNTIAVHQILQYLEMGICEALEGTNGAYSEYMKDVRTEKICNSIADLKVAISNMMQAVIANQSLLIQEIKNTNGNILLLQAQMKSKLQSIHGEIALAHQDMKLATEKFGSANQTIEEMRKIMMASAHNEYISLREQNINNYCVKHRLRDPGLLQ